MDMLKQVFKKKIDVLSALVFYKSLHGGANCYVQDWWEGSYSRILFPKVTLPSQRISDVLKEFGDEELQRVFFDNYLQYISSRCKSGDLIDSTGLPNDTHFPLTAINNHNGIISNEARLIYVLDKVSKLPIYFRYVAGNIVDVSTLQTTIAELKMYGINVDHAIVDAGYYSEKNVKSMKKIGISFVTRLSTNRKLYKELIAEHGASLEDAKYLVKYRDRFVYIKCVEIDLFGTVGYAYIAEDIDRKHDEVKKYIGEALDNKDLTPEQMNAAIHTKGLFVLITSESIEPEEILPLYYTREAIEQVFDISKNNVDLLPLRVHSIESFRGHLLISFIASIAYILVDETLKGSDFCALGAYQILRNLKCKVYNKTIIVQEANKKMNDIAKYVKMEFPQGLDI
jgi:transposase